MPRKKWDHEIHQYAKVVFKKKEGETVLWRCIITNCQHYLVGEMVLGKLSLCNRCQDSIFEMKPAHLFMKKPHCLGCTKRYPRVKGRASIDEIAANLNDLLKVE